MDLVRLNIWEVKYIPPGTIVDSGELGPCVGVMIYDALKKAAYAGHFVYFEGDGLEDMITQAVTKFGAADMLQAYVAGSSIDTIHGGDFLEQVRKVGIKRNYVTELLKQNGFIDSNVRIRWNPTFNSIANLVLNVDLGEAVVAVRDLDSKAISWYPI